MNRKESFFELLLSLIAVMTMIGAIISAMGVNFKAAFFLLLASLVLSYFLEKHYGNSAKGE